MYDLIDMEDNVVRGTVLCAHMSYSNQKVNAMMMERVYTILQL